MESLWRAAESSGLLYQAAVAERDIVWNAAAFATRRTSAGGCFPHFHMPYYYY